MAEITNTIVAQNGPKDRIYNLTIELKETKTRKKEVTGALNEEIKRIQKEIDDLIEEQEEDAPFAVLAPAPARVVAGPVV